MREYPALDIGIDPLAERETYEQVLAEFDGLSLLGVEELWTSVRLTFSDPADRDRAADRVRQAWPDRSCVSIDVPDEDWAARSQATLTAIVVGDYTVSPPWDLPADPQTPHIVIQPSMGFGTGHHASTRLCMQLMTELGDLGGWSVLDIGTGSGVLAVLAARMGASRVVAIDNDPDAVASARENLALNDVGDKVDLRVASLTDPTTLASDTFDLMLANLTGAMLIREASRLVELVAAGGRLIASGFETHELEQVAAAMESVKLGILEKRIEDDWVGVVLRRQERST